MASGSYAISGLKLGDPKRKKRDRLGWKVEADKQSVKRGEVVTFTITAENAKFPDGTKRRFVISENFSEADIVDGKIAGEFELFGNKATVEIGIEETYEKPQDETLRFGVTSTFASASVNVESDGGEKDVKRLRGREEQKKLPSRQEPIKRVTVRQLQLPPGKGSIVPRTGSGITRGGGRKALPPGGPRLPGTTGGPTPSVRMPGPSGGVSPQSSGIGDLFNNAIQMGTDAKGNYLTKQERIAAFKKGRPARPTKGVKPITALSKKGGAIGKIGKTISKEVGGGLAKTGGKAVAKGAGKAVAKGAGKAVAKKIPGVGLLAGAAFGIERLLKGDIIGAVGELASGAASTVPGVGTAVSLGIDGALMAGDMMGGTGGGGQKLLPPAKFKAGGTIVPGMTNMPFSMPGLNGIFNEPGNPEVMSILPLNPLKGIADAFGGGLQNIFGGKEKEYKGIASAIGAEMEKRGIGDPLGLKGGKSFGNSVRDLLDKIPGIKDIFGNRGGNTQGQQQGTSPGGPGGPGGPVGGGNSDNMLAAYLSTLEGGSGQNAADAMQVMLNRATQNHSGYGTNVGNQAMAEGQFTPFSAAIYGPGADPNANAAYGHIAPMLGNTPEERKAKLRQIAATEGFAGLDRIFNKNKASEASAILSDFQSGGAMSTAARNDVKGRAYFKGQTDLQNMRSGDMYRGTGGNYFHDDRNLSQLPVGMLQNVSPTLSPMAGGGAGQTVVLAGGTNTANDPVRAGRDMMDAIRNLKAKGYRVVVVPPNQKEYGRAYSAIKSAASNEGAIIEEGVYETRDPAHLTPQFASQLNSKYAGAIFMGDSNAARIAGDRGLSGVRREGAGTGEILQQAQQAQRAPQAPANNQNNQLNPGFQQMSYTPSASNAQAAAAASIQPQTPMQPTAMLEGAGTFIQGDTGASRGPHFHIGPETELWNKPEGKAEVRRASFKIAKALIGKGERFSFTNAMIDIDPNNPPDDATLMKYIEQEQIAHAGRDGGGSFGGIDIAGKPGLRLPLGVHNYKESSTGFGNTATIAGTRAFVAHGMQGSGNTPGANALAPGAVPSSNNGVQLMSNTSAAPAGNPEDFFSFAFGAQGRGSSYQAPPNAAPTALLEGSANTAMAAAGPKVAIVNNPVNQSSNISGSGGGGQSQSSRRGSDMSDAGLLAYMARQRLLTLGA